MRFATRFFAFVLMILPALADPSSYNRVISFGDSLQDNGNLYRNTFNVGGLATAVPVSPPVPGGTYDQRFSNGPTWIELVSSIPLASNPSLSSNPTSSMNNFWSGSGFFSTTGVTTTGNVNAAIGGALSNGFTGAPLPGIPGVFQQIQDYHNAG